MSEVEQKIIESLGQQINRMSDFQKGYLLGMAESKVDERKESNERQHKDYCSGGCSDTGNAT